MQNNRQPPTKRYSSYNPSEEILLEDQVSSSDTKACHKENGIGPKLRTQSVASDSVDRTTRRKSLNTLHFDALQSAVSKLSRIDDFDLEELGYGFFSDVFKVTHKQSGKVMVLKRNKNTNTKLNILREVQLMNRLAHPNILKFMGVCVHEGQLHALTEFINGGDIDQLVQKKLFLPWSVRVHLACDVSKGLRYLHSLGIFHRDLTAKNCLVKVTTNETGKKKYSAVLADLGLAEKIPTNEEEKQRLSVVGTPYCMAPEVLCQKPYDERSDLFSFGLLICQLIIRTSSDPELLPRRNDFGLNRDLFSILVQRGDGAPEMVSGLFPASMPPAGFLQLGYDCCKVDPGMRPSLNDIVKRLEDTIADVKLEKHRLKASSDAKKSLKRHSVCTLPSATQSKSAYSPLSRTEEADGLTNNSKEMLRASYDTNCSKRYADHHPRLARSSSDVSKELITRAACVIASSQFSNELGEIRDDINDVVLSLSEAFINPFSNVENTDLKEHKLFDVPSLEVLEMAFDLPTPRHSNSGRLKQSQGSPVHMRRNQHVNTSRPKSLMLIDPDLKTDVNPNADSDCLASSPISPLLSETTCVADALMKRHQNDASEGDLKHALIRSVVFSPHGTRMMSNRYRDSRGADWRCVSSLLSIISTKIGSFKKSISVPDLTRFTDADVLKLRGRRSLQFGSSPSASPSHVSTTGNSQSPCKLDPTAYPSYATLPRKKKKARASVSSVEAMKKRLARNSDDILQDPTLLETLSEETQDATSRTPCEAQAARRLSTTPPSTPTDATQWCHRNHDEINSPASKPPSDASSSSDTSGNSSTGLQMSLRSAAVSCSRRGVTKNAESHDVCSTRRCNRDSGYDEDGISVASSCESLSIITARCVDNEDSEAYPHR